MAQKILEPFDLMFKRFEPKKRDRFRMLINISANESIPTYIVKAANRPTIAFNKLTIDHINRKFHIKGKGDWQDITLTLYDPITPSGAQYVMEWINMHYETITGRDGYADFYKKDITLELLGPVGDVVEAWELKGAFITNVNFGNLDWSADDIQTIDITLAYDYAVLLY